MVSVLPGQVMGPEGFLLTVSLSQVHLPRMWVEKHPDKDSQVCVFDSLRAFLLCLSLVLFFVKQSLSPLGLHVGFLPRL